MSETFEEWATRVLGPLVQGVNQDQWANCRDCWETAKESKGAETN